MKNELKPCPFCGGNAVVIRAPLSGVWFIQCKTCAAMIGRKTKVVSTIHDKVYLEAREAAESAWNRRDDDGKVIDADKINYHDHTECMGHGDFEIVRTVTDKEIAEIPTVYAVPVVRCRERKHCDPENHHCDHYMGTAAPLRRKPDDFCSYGERKEGDK